MVVEILLTKGNISFVDDIDSDLAKFKWCDSKGYAVRRVRVGAGGIVYMHRIVLERALGYQIPSDKFPDHINLNKADNRRSNLRLASRRQNNINSPPFRDATSIYKGVKHSSNKTHKWVANITIKNKSMHLGTFDTQEEAARAYDGAARHFYGEFAYLNFPDEYHPYQIKKSITHTHNTSGYRGVYKTKKGRILAYINYNKKRYHIGSYNNPQEAARAYDKRAKELLGDKAILNFPDD